MLPAGLKEGSKMCISVSEVSVWSRVYFKTGTSMGGTWQVSGELMNMGIKIRVSIFSCYFAIPAENIFEVLRMNASLSNSIFSNRLKGTIVPEC